MKRKQKARAEAAGGDGRAYAASPALIYDRGGKRRLILWQEAAYCLLTMSGPILAGMAVCSYEAVSFSTCGASTSPTCTPLPPTASSMVATTPIERGGTGEGTDLAKGSFPASSFTKRD